MISNTLRMLLRGWWILLLTILISVGSAYIYTQLTAQVLYRVSTQMVISPSTELSEASDLMRSLDSLSRGMIIPTFAEIYQSDRIVNEAFREIDVSNNINSYKVTAYTLPETNILILSTTGPDAHTTQVLTKEISHIARDFIAQIYPMYTITILEEPGIPVSPIESEVQRNLIMAALLGAGLGLALVLLIYGDISTILGLAK